MKPETKEKPFRIIVKGPAYSKPYSDRILKNRDSAIADKNT